MAATFYAGKNGSISKDGQSLKLSKWSCSMDTAALKITNFSSGGFQENVSGIAGAKIQASGAYPTGDMALALGTVYTFLLGVGGAVGFTVAARVTNLTPSTDVEGVAQISISAESTGPFAPFIV